MSNEIVVVCSCGGFCSQLTFIISWLTIVEGTPYKIKIGNNCEFKHCHWKKTLEGYNIWKYIIKPFKFDDKEKNGNINDLGDIFSKLNHINNGVIYLAWDTNNKKNKKNGLFDLRFEIDYNDGNIITLISDKEKFQKVRDIVNKIWIKHIKFTDEMNSIVGKYNKYYNKYTIGLHIRTSQHYKLNGKYTSKKIIDYFYQSLMKLKLPDEYNLFIATSNDQILDYFKKKYGKNIKGEIFHLDTLREKYSIEEKTEKDYKINDWTGGDFKDRIKRYGLKKYYQEVCLDLILLSKCNHIIGGESNVFFNALCYNKDSTYSIPDILVNTGHR